MFLLRDQHFKRQQVLTKWTHANFEEKQTEIDKRQTDRQRERG